MAFDFEYMDGGGDGYLIGFPVKSGESIEKGMMCKITTGEAEPADTTDTTMFGAAQNDADEGEIVYLYPPGAVYSVIDANARNTGSALDLATGSLLVADKLNDDLVVVEESSATEKTKVKLHDNANIFANAD